LNSLLIILLITTENCVPHDDLADTYRCHTLMADIMPSQHMFYQAGVSALFNGDLEQSIAYLSALVYKHAVTYHYLGVAHYQLERYDDAAHFFHLSYVADSTIWQTRYYLGLIELKHNRIVGAMPYFEGLPVFEHKAWLLEYIADYDQLMRAHEKFVAGDYGVARILYGHVRYFPQYRDMGLALTLARVDEYEASLELLDSLIQASDDEHVRTRSLWEAVDVSLALGDVDGARTYLRQYIARSPTDQAYFLLGKTYSDEGRYDSAAVYFKNLPDSVDEYLFYKGRTDYFLGLWGRSEEELLRHRELYSFSEFGDRSTFILASINYRRKEYDFAITFWNDLVTLYPLSIYAPAAQKGIADAYFEKKEYKNAFDAYRKALQYEPPQGIAAQSRLRLYELRYYLKEVSTLLDALRRFVEENPNSPLILQTRLRVATILFDKKAYYQSLVELEKIIAAAPETDMGYKVLMKNAQVHRELGQVSEVKRAYQYIIMSDAAEEHHSYAADELASLYVKDSEFDSALYYYNMLLDDEKYEEKSLLEIARIYEQLGQDNEAGTMVDRLVQKFPSSVFLFDAYLIKIKLYKKQGHYDAAISMLNGLLKTVGQKPEVYVQIGDLYYEIENYVEARKNYLLACEQFKQRRDDAALALIRAGDASMQLADRAQAREYYLQASLIANSLSIRNKATAQLNAVGED
jgi:tetratricopeptide (TPR) repeat protein